MSKLRLQWTGFILISLVFVGSIAAVNIWISGQIKGIQEGFTVAPQTTDVVPHHAPAEAIQKRATVRIDPGKDPLAPREKVRSAPVKKVAPSNAPSRMYEVSPDSPILVQ